MNYNTISRNFKVKCKSLYINPTMPFINKNRSAIYLEQEIVLLPLCFRENQMQCFACRELTDAKAVGRDCAEIGKERIFRCFEYID